MTCGGISVTDFVVDYVCLFSKISFCLCGCYALLKIPSVCCKIIAFCLNKKYAVEGINIFTAIAINKV